MKKLSFIILLIINASSLCSAQAIIVNGTVKNEQGNAIHYAFIKDGNSATYTDAFGNFSLPVESPSKINITCKGYDDATVDPAGNVSLQIILKGSRSVGATAIQGDAKLLQDAFTNKNVNTSGSGIGFGGTPVFTDSKQIVGHRFLFTEWVPGYMVKADGGILQTPDYLFNYDKIKGDLFIAQNLNDVIFADKNVVKSFTLFYGDKPYTFEKMTGISTDLFTRVISAGSKYKIYKLTKTKFVKANYTSNGITSSGSANDEFADENSYYIQDLKTGNFQQVALKKKAIKAAFPNDADKLNTFIAAHARDSIDDDYLKALGDALNQ